MNNPKFQEYMRALLEVLTSGKSLPRKELYEAMALKFNLSQEQMLETTKAGHKLIYKDRIHWAITYLTRAGLVERLEDGSSRITNEGKVVVLDKENDINSKFLERYESFKIFKYGYAEKNNNELECNDNESQLSTPTDRIEEAILEIHNDLQETVLKKIIANGPDFFEHLVLKLLCKMGYSGTNGFGYVTASKCDGGIDGIVYSDELALNPICYQAKKWTNQKVGGPEIDAFFGAMSKFGYTKGIIATTNTFTNNKKSESRGNQVARFIDGKDIINLMIKYNVGIETSTSYETKKINDDFFKDEEY